MNETSEGEEQKGVDGHVTAYIFNRLTDDDGTTTLTVKELATSCLVATGGYENNMVSDF